MYISTTWHAVVLWARGKVGCSDALPPTPGPPYRCSPANRLAAHYDSISAMKRMDQRLVTSSWDSTIKVGSGTAARYRRGSAGAHLGLPGLSDRRCGSFRHRLAVGISPSDVFLSCKSTRARCVEAAESFAPGQPLGCGVMRAPLCV